MASRSRQPVHSQRKDFDPPRREQWAPGEWWEWLAIFFAIAALWPKILRWESVVWDIALLAAMVLMIVVFVRRVRRMRRSWKDE